MTTKNKTAHDASSAEAFLINHYQDDILDAEEVRSDAAHWNWVFAQPDRFPDSDTDFIIEFDAAATVWLEAQS